MIWFQLWDVNMDSGPVATFQVHEYLRPKVNYFKTVFSWNISYEYSELFELYFDKAQLCDLYENDSIFDKFECCLSGDGLRVATGSYRSVLAFFSYIIVVIGSFSNRRMKTFSNLFRIFGCAPGSTEATTLEASKNPMR